MKVFVTTLVFCSLFLQHSYAENSACPSFEDGSWSVGELRNFQSVRGQWSRIAEKHYGEKTPRSCCDACAVVEECKYWTIFLYSKTAIVGDCYLYKSFACEKPYDGILPFIPNRLARSGPDVCEPPQATFTSNASLEEKRDSAIAEMRALLNAEIAVREEEAERWQNETESSELKKVKAEEDAGKWRAKSMELQQSVEKTKKELADLEEELSLAEANFTQCATEAANEAESAHEAKEEHKRLLNEIKNARLAKEAADLLLTTEMAIENKEATAERNAHPYTICPLVLEKGEWAVGRLRNLSDASGKDTKLSKTLPDTIPQDCCSECATLEDCAYWSWEIQNKTDSQGECHFFTSSACTADSEGNLPFQHNTRLGRGGAACQSSSQ